MKRIDQQKGFTLVEMLTALALLSLIATSLWTVMNNLNAQTEVMNAQTELLVAGDTAIETIRVWVERAGYTVGATALPTGKYFRRVSAREIALCFDLDATTRRVMEFRYMSKQLEQRITDNSACVGAGNWVPASDTLFGDIVFTSVVNDASAPIMIDVTMRLEKILPDTGTKRGTVIAARLPLYAASAL